MHFYEKLEIQNNLELFLTQIVQPIFTLISHMYMCAIKY